MFILVFKAIPHKFRTLLKSQRCSIIIGNLLEHFDSSLYGFLAPLIGKSFFPSFSPLYQLILAYSIYLITYVARPLGGLFFSKLTYQLGAFRALFWTLMGVALSTGLMGCLPSTQQIGFLAPCLLVATRFMQSFCAAGESTIAGYYLIEKVSEKEQLPWAGIYQSSTVLGILFASAVSALISSSSDNEGLWRLAFLLGSALGLWGLWMRSHFQNESSLPLSPLKGSLLHTLKSNWKLVIYLIPIYGFSYLTYSVPIVFLNPFLLQVTSFPLSDLVYQAHSLLWLDAFLLPALALFVHRFEWYKTLISGALIFILGCFFLFISLPSSSFVALFLFRLIMIIGGVGFAAALLPWTARLYPPQEKYLLHSISYNIGSEIFGRSTPVICLWLYAATGLAFSPLIYILSLVTISLGLILWLQFGNDTWEYSYSRKEERKA